jgi:hypothetical protein
MAGCDQRNLLIIRQSPDRISSSSRTKSLLTLSHQQALSID